MKRTIKKLAVLMIVAAITMFSAAAIAWDDDHDWKNFHGKYAGSTVGTCISTAQNGFNPDFTVIDMTQTRFNSFIAQDIWTFKADGTATVEGTRALLYFGPSPFSIPEADGSAVTYSYGITYDLKHDGTITTELIPGMFEGKPSQGGPPIPGLTFTYGPYSHSGMVSQDYKTITLGTTKVEIATVTLFSNGSSIGSNDNVCTDGVVLIRVGE